MLNLPDCMKDSLLSQFRCSMLSRPIKAYFSDSVRGYFKAPRPSFGSILRVLGGAQSALDYSKALKRLFKGL